MIAQVEQVGRPIRSNTVLILRSSSQDVRDLFRDLKHVTRFHAANLVFGMANLIFGRANLPMSRKYLLRSIDE